MKCIERIWHDELCSVLTQTKRKVSLTPYPSVVLSVAVASALFAACPVEGLRWHGSNVRVMLDSDLKHFCSWPSGLSRSMPAYFCCYGWCCWLFRCCHSVCGCLWHRVLREGSQQDSPPRKAGIPHATPSSWGTLSASAAMELSHACTFSPLWEQLKIT